MIMLKHEKWYFKDSIKCPLGDSVIEIDKNIILIILVYKNKKNYGDYNWLLLTRY